MLRLYKLTERERDIIEAFDLFKIDKSLKGIKVFSRKSVERYLERLYENELVYYRKIKRADTTTYLIPVVNPDNKEDVDVKLTLRFDEEDFYSSHRYYNINMEVDMEYFEGLDS